MSLAFAISFLVVYSFTSGALIAYSNSATVPINIKVNGKLIISDENSDSNSNKNTVVETLMIDRTMAGFNLSDSYTLRIRSNESRWKLIGNFHELPVRTKKINPRFIKLTYRTSAGSAGNVNSAMLSAPFNAPVALSSVPKKTDFVVLEGNSKTSLHRDSGNKNNWYGLSFSVDFVGKNGIALDQTNPIYKKRKYNAIVSYTLVSL